MAMKHNYINILLVIACAATAFSCSRQLDETNGGGADYIRATISQDKYLTKTIVVDNPGRMVNTYWKEGDKMGIFGGSSSNLEFTIAPGDISIDGKSANFRSESSVPEGNITAYVPYSNSAKMNGSNIVLEMPSVQNIVFAKGKIQADPGSNIMVASGSREAGLDFHNVLSLLKIGQTFENDVRLVKVEFRDLSGKAVCGAMTVKDDGDPSAEITGSGKVITLDLGQGLSIAAGEVPPLYLYVPARNYSKGFELKFITAGGDSQVRTVGTKSGKNLERSILYTIGDIPALDYISGATAVLQDGVLLMTPEKLEKIKIISDANMSVLKDREGNICYDRKGAEMYRPDFDLLVHKDLEPEVGKLMLFEGGVEKLPYGGIYRITSCSVQDEQYFRVEAKAEADIAQAYKEVKAGTPVFDDDGNVIEGGGLPIDIASNIQYILDDKGNEVPFSIDSDGNIMINESDVADMLGLSTKKMVSHTYKLPKLGINAKQPNGEALLGAQMSIDSKFAVGFIAGEFQYVHFTFAPKLTLSVDFTLKAEFTISQDMHLITLGVAPIPVVPGLFLCPEIDFSASVGVGGDIKFTASLKYVYDMGMYGFSYNEGDGFSFRHKVADPPKEDNFKPELGGFSGSISAFGAITATPYMSLTGLFGAGIDCTTTLKFATTWTETSTKLTLAPELEFVPMTASLGGLFSKKWKNLTSKIEFDPIWEMELTPQLKVSKNPFTEVQTDKRFIVPFRELNPVHLLSSFWTCGLELPYSVKLAEPYFMPLKIALDLYTGEPHYYPYKWPEKNGDSFEIFRYDVCAAAGVPNISYSVMGLDKPKKLSRQIIGEFPLGETGEISGKLTGFASGQAHGYTISCIYPDGTETILSGGNGTSSVQLEPGAQSKFMTIPGSMYHPAIFFWPTRANGGGYYTTDKEAQDGI